MLTEIRIQGLGVIDDAVTELAPGLTVVTGETGAGKTMVVQGLTLLFGGRGDAGRVRPGASRAVVEGRLVLDADHPAVLRALDAGGELDGDELLIVRSVGADGRSRAHLGGRSVPVGVLAELSERVVAVHGQSDQQRLLSGARQRDALDRFGELGGERERVTAAYDAWREARRRHEQLQAEVADRRREAERLRAALAEVQAAEPQAGEDEALRAAVRRLDAADDLRQAATTASTALTGTETGDEPDALGLLVAARRALEAAADADPPVASLAARVAEAALLVGDVAADVSAYATGIDVDPATLATSQDRLAVLTGLVRSHAPAGGLDDVLAWADQASVRLLALDGTDDDLVALADAETRSAAALVEVATRLSAAREKAATCLGDQVSAELTELAMPHAQVVAALSQREDPVGLAVGDRTLAVGPHGLDDVELLLSPHPGAPQRALHRGASGGELSRVMLAVEVVLAGTDPVPVMVFDEVDAGVGGRAAVEVGRRLARLARDHQVLVVTHLPQVAAFADQHLQVVKSDDGSITTSGVVALDDAGRVAELSRMLAGLDSGLARGHAEELLASSKAMVRADAR